MGIEVRMRAVIASAKRQRTVMRRGENLIAKVVYTGGGLGESGLACISRLVSDKVVSPLCLI